MSKYMYTQLCIDMAFSCAAYGMSAVMNNSYGTPTAMNRNVC